jgi:hypothetical protein
LALTFKRGIHLAFVSGEIYHELTDLHLGWTFRRSFVLLDRVLIERERAPYDNQAKRL